MASAFLILPPNKVTRRDGTVVKVDTSTDLRTELKGMMHVFKDWRLLALIPVFFASSYFYAYLGALNTSVFDSPTRALNATLGGIGEIVGSVLIGWCVYDVKGLRRRNRGFMGLAVVAGITTTLWAVGLAWQVKFGRDYKASHGGYINYHDADYKGKGALFFFCTSPSSGRSGLPCTNFEKTTFGMLAIKRLSTGQPARSPTIRSQLLASPECSKRCKVLGPPARMAWTRDSRHS